MVGSGRVIVPVDETIGKTQQPHAQAVSARMALPTVWLLTLPAAIMLSGSLCFLSRQFV